MTKQELLAFREEETVVVDMDEAASKLHIDRSEFIRRAVRVAIYGPFWYLQEIQRKIAENAAVILAPFHAIEKSASEMLATIEKEAKNREE